MATMTFKIEDSEAEAIRKYANSQGITVSEYLRRKARVVHPAPPRSVKAKYSGAPVFAGDPGLRPLTDEAVQEMLADFP